MKICFVVPMTVNGWVSSILSEFTPLYYSLIYILFIQLCTILTLLCFHTVLHCYDFFLSLPYTFPFTNVLNKFILIIFIINLFSKEIYIYVTFSLENLVHCYNT